MPGSGRPAGPLRTGRSTLRASSSPGAGPRSARTPGRGRRTAPRSRRGPRARRARKQAGVALDLVALPRRQPERLPRALGVGARQGDERVEDVLAGQVRDGNDRVSGRGPDRGGARSCPRTGAAVRARVRSSPNGIGRGRRAPRARVVYRARVARRRVRASAPRAAAARGVRRGPRRARCPRRLPRGRPGRGRAGGPGTAAAAGGTGTSGRRHRPAVRHPRPGRLHGPRPGDAPERRSDGYRVHYAIADVARVRRSRRRDGRRGAPPRRRRSTARTPRTPLHPTVLSEGAASLLPPVRPARRAVDHRPRRRRRGQTWSTCAAPGCAAGRSWTTTGCSASRRAATPTSGWRCCARSAGCVSRSPRSGAAVDMRVPGPGGRGGRRRLPPRSRACRPRSRTWNAQISLLTGMCAAAHHAGRRDRGSCARCRHRRPRTSSALRRTAVALGIEWPDRAGVRRARALARPGAAQGRSVPRGRRRPCCAAPDTPRSTARPRS